MNDKKLLRNGIVGTVITALCCFTPILVVMLGLVGLSAIIGGLDYFLFPMLFASLGVIGYALYMRSGYQGPSPGIVIAVLVIALSTFIIWLEFRYALRITLGATAIVAAYAFYLYRSAKSPTALG